MSTEPAPQQGAPPDGAATRRFTAGEQAWIARLAGETLGGTGMLGTVRIAVVDFFREDERAPRFQALLPTGDFEHLYDSELARLLASARPLPPPEG